MDAKASVIILTYSHPQNLKRIVAALEPQDCEIIIAEDGLGFIHPEDFSQDVKVFSHDRIGARRASARNGGAALATTDNFIFLDDDALPSPWLVEEHLAALADFDASEGSLTSVGWDIDTDMRFRRWGYAPPSFERRNMFWTANLGIRRGVFEAVGGFDMRYDGEYGYEDSDLGEALRRLPASVYWNPEAVARNLDPSGQWLHSEGVRNKLRFEEKWSTPKGYTGPKVLLTLPGFAYASLEWAEGLGAALDLRGCEVIVFDFNDLLGQLNDAVKDETPDRAEMIFLVTSQQLAPAIARYRPDWLIIVEGTRLHKLAWEAIATFDVRVGLVLTESPYRDEQQAKFAEYADVVFCNEKDSVSKYQNGVYLPASYDRMKHRRRSLVLDFRRDLLVAMGETKERREFLETGDWSGIDLGLVGQWDIPYGHVLYTSHIATTISNATLARYYNSAKMGLNVYRENMGSSLNPRAYEMSACGCLQLATPRAEAKDVLGGALIEVASPIQAERMVRYLLKADEERRAMVMEAEAKVKGCSYDDRVDILIEGMGGF